MINELTKSTITNNGVLYIKKVKNFAYDHVFIYGQWRIFYTLKGDTAPKDITDSNQDGVPDYIDSMLFRLETARILFSQSFSLLDPTIGGFYFDLGVKYIDIFIQNIPKPMGIVSNIVIDNTYQILNGTQFQGKSLSIRLDRNLVPATSTPIHEFFHLVQFNYTQISNPWFMEGIARWSQLIFEKRVIKKYKLPSNVNELQTLLSQAHGAEVFWNRLADMCAQKNEFKLPDFLQNNSVIFQQNRTGIEFVKIFLSLLNKYSNKTGNHPDNSNLETNTYWPNTRRSSASNNKYIFRAIIEAVNKTCKNKSKELIDFLNLIHPIAYHSHEAYDTPEIQLFMGFLQKVNGNYTRLENGILISDHFEPFSGTLTLDLDLSGITLNNDEIKALWPLKQLDGNLIFNENQQLSNLNGLRNLRTVSGKLRISANPIEQLSGLNNLEQAGELEISGLTHLASISEIQNLKNIKKIVISDNARLHSINGFTKLEEIELLLQINNNPVLGEINGFTSLFAITNGSFKIENNSALYSINGFCSLTNIKTTLVLKDSPALTNIEFLSSLKTTDSILFSHLKITSADPLRQLFKNSTHFKGYIKLLHCPISDLTFMHGLQSVGSSFYLHNNQLQTLSGLESLEYVGASFSILKNRLHDISHLSNLKKVAGMLGLANNQLKNLNGLESLTYIQTTKWNGKLCNLSLYGNQDLVDIKALSNITEQNKNIIVLVDNDQNFAYKPDENSLFSNNKIKVLSASYHDELEPGQVYTLRQWKEFEAIAQCAAGSSCYLCRNQKYGYAWRQALQKVTTLPPGGINFACPFGKSWSRYGYISKSRQLSETTAQPLSILEQLTFASRHQDNQSFPKTKWGTTIDIVYPYFAAGQKSDDELRYSLRSLSNLYEKINVWIVGDKPLWLNLNQVHYIPHEKESKSSYIDSRAKVKLAAQDPRMGSHFIYMNDDLYFIVPVSTAYLGIPRYFADYTGNLQRFKVNVEYHKLELKGLEALQKKERPMRNYGLHWPYVYNTKLFLEIYKEFELDKNSHNSETLYYNTYAEAIIPYSGDLLRSNEVVKEEFKLTEIPKNILVLNNKIHGFKQIKIMLSQLFPNPCDYET